MLLLAINCGSSSIKGKLYAIPTSSTKTPLEDVAELSVSNISSKGEKIKIKIKYGTGKGKNVDEEGEDGGSVDYHSLVPLLLKKLTESGHLEKEDIKYVTHRIVHGGTHKTGITITREHSEGLAEMDKLSEFAPLHNHHAVLAVKSCLDTLPDHTSFLCFDTLFHQTLPPSVYTYALPPGEVKLNMPIRKYGFHGLSYASIVSTLSEKLEKPSSKINIVVAHLGSGASSCCIKNGQSIDTSMGLTPLEGLIGGTRSGTIDPTAIFHLMGDPASDGGVQGMKVSKGELLLNKKSGLQALAGTTNFGKIITQKTDPSSCSDDDHKSSSLAYEVYMDRLLSYISQYIFKLLSTTPKGEIDGIVFSGGIGEKASVLRKDVLESFGWLGCVVDDRVNEDGEGTRRVTKEGSGLGGWVVETDEEGWCAQMAREEFGF